MTPSDLAASLDRAAQQLPGALQDAVDETLKEGLKIAEQHSSGTLTPTDLRRADHPFARRHGRIRSPGREDVINRRTGDFAEAWEIEAASVKGDEVSGSLFNIDPKAELLFEGTDVMLGRDLPEAIERELMPMLDREVGRALGRLL